MTYQPFSRGPLQRQHDAQIEIEQVDVPAEARGKVIAQHFVPPPTGEPNDQPPAQPLKDDGMSDNGADGEPRPEAAAEREPDVQADSDAVREAPYANSASGNASQGDAKRAQTDKVASPRFPLMPFDQLKISTEPAYLVKGILPCRGLAVIWGPPKCGKSFVAFDMLLHVALGWLYRERRVKQGAVVYAALEGASGFGARAEAFRQANIAEQASAEIPFRLMPARLSLVADHQAFIAAIKAQMQGLVPAVVCIDTLNRSITGSESDDKDMGAYVKAADALREAFNCLVVIVHHCGIDATRPRGHTSLTGAVDAQLAVKRESSGAVMLTVEYMKDGPEGDVLASRLEQVKVGTDDDGDPITSCVVVPIKVQPSAAGHAKLSKAAKLALQALSETVLELGRQPEPSPQIPAGMNVVSIDEWRERAYRMGISDAGPDAKRKAFKRAYEELLITKRVAIWDEKAWLPK
jgi:hypothetical protein